MMRVLDIAQKNLTQMMRNRMTFLFFLIMPVLFTLLIGYANGAFSSTTDSRLLVGYIDSDNSTLSKRLLDLLSESQVMRLKSYAGLGQTDLENLVVDEQLAAALVIPPGFGRTMMHGKRARIILVGDTSSTIGMSIKSELLTNSLRLENAARTALIFDDVNQAQTPFRYILDEAITKWRDPPITVEESTSSLLQEQRNRSNALVHISPGLMLQFAIAGLMTAAQIIVNERKSRAMQRILTMAAARLHILLGHFLSMLIIISFQFVALISFGQFALGVDYLREPLATGLVALCSAVCFAALGLLIGTLAHNEDQAVVFSLVPMFAFAGLGGAWVPLEVTGEVFQTIGHLTPVAWGIDGFKNVIIRGWGVESALAPAAILLGYGLLFFGLSIWKFRAE